MRLGYVILYVRDLEATVEFYERAFGLKRKFMAGTDYAELDTGATTLSFAAEGFAASHGAGFTPTRPNALAPAAEIAFVTDDPDSAYARALAAGATSVSPPERKPWGQTVAYVRDRDGFLVELCSPTG